MLAKSAPQKTRTFQILQNTGYKKPFVATAFWPDIGVFFDYLSCLNLKPFRLNKNTTKKQERNKDKAKEFERKSKTEHQQHRKDCRGKKTFECNFLMFFFFLETQDKEEKERKRQKQGNKRKQKRKKGRKKEQSKSEI